MSTTPTDPGGGGPPLGATFGSSGSIARLPMPGNAEFAVYFIVEVIFVLIWIIADSVNTRDWVLFTTILTAFYLVSRGIAKASRVLEA